MLIKSESPNSRRFATVAYLRIRNLLTYLLTVTKRVDSDTLCLAVFTGVFAVQ